MAARKDYAAKKATDPVAQPAEQEIGLTVNGMPIPDHLKHVIAYDLTDQGKAEANERLKASGRLTETRVSVVSGEFDKSIDRYRDEDDGPGVFESTDPYRSAINRTTNPEGKHFHLFGDATVDREGKRGFVPERDAKGNLIKVGNMTLGSMPLARHERREKEVKDFTLGIEKSQAETFQELQRKEARDSNSGITPLSTGDSVGGEQTYAYSGSGEPVAIGHIRQVGNSGAILTGV